MALSVFQVLSIPHPQGRQLARGAQSRLPDAQLGYVLAIHQPRSLEFGRRASYKDSRREVEGTS